MALLTLDQEARLTATEALQHPWLSSHARGEIVIGESDLALSLVRDMFLGLTPHTRLALGAKSVRLDFIHA